MTWLDSPVRLAVEREPSSWTLVAAKRTRHASPQPVAAAAFADTTVAVQDEIRRFRVRQQLPFEASLIYWPEPGDRGVATLDVRSGGGVTLPKAHVIRQRVAPFVRAGGRVREVLLPHEAVGRLVHLAGWSSACVLVMHASGACLAVANSGILRASYLAWPAARPAGDDAERLLARYQLAARLVPHLREWAGSAPAARVAVCGSCPDLRSAMMPIVEELDREIDVLDAFLVGQPVDETADPNDISRRQLAWAAAAGAPW